MAQAEVVVENSKSDIVTRYKERIELLFNVVVSVKTLRRSPGFVEYGSGENNNTTFALQLSSPTSQESLEKAIIFLKAALEESPEFTIERHSFPHEEFEMVLKDSQAIERQCRAVLDFDFSTRELCMKGERVNVEAAKQQVHKLIMGQQNVDQASLSQRQPHISASGTVHQQITVQNVSNETSVCDTGSGIPQDLNCQPFGSSFRDLDNNVILEPSLMDSMRSYSLTTDAEQSSCSITDTDLAARGSGTGKSLSRTFAQVVSLRDFDGKVDTETDDARSDSDTRTVETEECGVKEVASDHSSSSTASSDEDSGVSVVDKSDPRYEIRLEFAVKLGYTECDLDKVINKHGLGCDENRLLQELIENSAGCVNPEGENVESHSPVLPVPDIASSEVFQGVMKKLNKSEDSGSNLRHIVIDGSNVAMSHGKNVFSCRGIKIAVDWFRQRGHEEITVFVPQWRKETSRPDTPITDQNILIELEKEGIVVFTPARRIKGRRVVCYDDRFVLKLAAETNGIVVSNDNYRDLLNENQEYRTVVDERLLMYTFVNDRFMPPEDPMGRRGPTLNNFLCKEPTSPPTLPPECPYGRKCTYGNKCKYHHPERGSQPHKTVTEVLKEQATIKMQERAVKGPEPQEKSRRSKPKLTRTRSLAPGEPLPGEKNGSSMLPQALKEPDTDTFSRLKSPTRVASKTSDYLREHRKKLEEVLAIASAADPGVSTAQSGAVCQVPEAVAASRPQEVLSPLPGLGSRVSSPSHLNVPFSSSQEGQLVSGHLLLAKKLSDEASESSFFSESSSNRASPVALAGPAMPGISRQESMPYSLDKFYDRRPSLQEHHQASQQYYASAMLPRGADVNTGLCMSGPMQLPSRQLSGLQRDQAFTAMPVHGAACQSYPSSGKEAPAHGMLRRVTSYSEQPPMAMAAVRGTLGMEANGRERVPVKPQHSGPPGQFLPTAAHFPGRPFRSMMRQNSSSDPQLHVIGSGDAPFNPWLSAPNPPPPASAGPCPVSALDSRGTHPAYSSADHRAPGEAHQHQTFHHSATAQPFSPQQPFGVRAGLDRQFSEVMYGSHDHGVPPTSPYMPPMGMFHSHPSTPVHHPSTPTHPPPTMAGLTQSSHLPQWSQNPMLGMPLSPVRSPQPAQRSFPADHPIPATDSRYPLYYNLCGIFAEPRVRAAMNKFPDETDPQKICASIVREL